MTIQDFKERYGTRGGSLLIEEFIRRAPEFPGDAQLARILGTLCADLETMLKEHI